MDCISRVSSSVFSFRWFLTQQGGTRIWLKWEMTNFKHNINQSPFDILTAREDLLPLCPVQAMANFFKLRDTHAGLLFCHSDTSPIPAGPFDAELHSCLSFCDLDTSRCKSHSFRIGLPVKRPTEVSLMLNPRAWPLEFTLDPTLCPQIDTPYR